MKKHVILGTMTLAAAILGMATQANADTVEKEVVNQTGETPTTVIVKDSENENGTDPLDPDDPTQTDLTLEKVPGSFDFETKLQNKQYTITGTTSTDKDIVVFNNRVERNWTVKASVADNKIERTKDNTSFDVTSFKVNGSEIAKTGSEGIVAKAEDVKTAENNTGLISTAVDSISIEFNDGNSTLAIGDELNGTVNYQLYATMETE